MADIVEIWSDIHQDIKSDFQGALKKVINAESVRTSINNILGTSLGERIFLPEFGSNLKSLLFEPINSHLLNRCSNEIRNAIEKWDDRVIIEGIDFTSAPDNNSISLILRFSIRSYTETFSYTTTLTQ